MHFTELPQDSLAVLRRGAVIPAHLLALDAERKLDARRQRAMTRYYLDAGAGGVAVGVHSTQFAIRDVGLYEPVLELAMQTAREWTPLGGKRPLFMVAGLAGRTEQAVREADIARGLGYHAGLLSLAAMKGATEDDLTAGTYSQVITDRFWDRHLTLARDRGCHREPPKVILQDDMVILRKLSSSADG